MDNSNTKYFLITLLIAISNLLLLYYFKYSQNGLSLKEFNLLKIGNLINLSFVLVLSIGLILLFIKNQNTNFRLFFTLSIIYFIPIILLFILKLIDYKYSQGYLFHYPYKKVIPLLLLLANQLLQLYLIVLVISSYFNCNKIRYFNSFFCVIAFIGLLVFISFVTSFRINNKELKNIRYDIGIVFGAAVWSGNKPSPIFRGRIEKGFELYKKGIIKKIQLTGGNAPGEISEARAATNYLKNNKHLNENNILSEEKTTTTNEQIKFIKENLLNNKKSKIIFISDNFHLKRILEMADFFNIEAVGVASDYKLSWKKSLFYRFRDSIGLLLFWIFGI